MTDSEIATGMTDSEIAYEIGYYQGWMTVSDPKAKLSNKQVKNWVNEPSYDDGYQDGILEC